MLARDCESPAYSTHVFKGSARSFSESAQRWRAEKPYRDSRRQQSSMRGYSEGRGSRGKRSNQRSAISMPRLHNFNRLRIAIDGIADRITDPQTSRNYRRTFHDCFRRTATRNNPRRIFSRGRRASTRSQVHHHWLANSRSLSGISLAKL
jgi:hypothetical protein